MIAATMACAVTGVEERLPRRARAKSERKRRARSEMLRQRGAMRYG